MAISIQDQIADIKKIIRQYEMCKLQANTRAQQDSDQRRIDKLNEQLVILERIQIES